MNCRRFNQILIELSRERFALTNEAKQHLATCSRCAKELQQQQALTRLLRTSADWPQARVTTFPDELRKAFLSRHQEKKQRSTRTADKIWAVAAVLLIVGLAATLSFRLNQLEKNPPSISQNNEMNAPGTIATEFFPLMPADTSPDYMQMVRVRLPRSALLQVGLPMNEFREDESILADVLISEEGLPYAIRFIHHQQK